VTRPRIIAGRWKGRVLQVPKAARPTSSRAREALFDVLQSSIADARVLDLFAGSGAIGLEALSRGASKAVFVEKNVQAIEANLRAFGAEAGRFELLRADAQDAVVSLLSRGEEFDVVFADPPYAVWGSVPARISELVAPGGTLVVQSDSDTSPAPPRGLVETERRAYGRNVFRFFGPKTS
jgi:16S rRNA (guanine966-N2)-methyltransferase